MGIGGKNKKVLVVATGRKTRGGITAVIKAYEQTAMWDEFHCHWVQTHRDGTVIRKICYLLLAWIDYLVRLPFYDIVHLHFSLPISAKRKYPFFKLARLMGKKTVIHLHCGNQLSEIWSPMYEKMFLQADKVLLLSENIKHHVAGYIGVRDNLVVLYNPCSLVDSKTPLPARENEILVAGTVNKNKGYEDIIRAWSLVAMNHPDWKLVFAGNGEIDRARSIAKENRVDNQTVFLGWVDKKAKEDAFHRASVLCMASYAEGFPMAVLDAFSYGLPVITSLVGGIGDIAIDGENMLVFNAGDVNKLARHLERMITDANLRENLAAASFKLSQTTFNIENLTWQLTSIYYSV